MPNLTTVTQTIHSSRSVWARIGLHPFPHTHTHFSSFLMIFSSQDIPGICGETNQATEKTPWGDRRFPGGTAGLWCHLGLGIGPEQDIWRRRPFWRAPGGLQLQQPDHYRPNLPGNELLVLWGCLCELQQLPSYSPSSQSQERLPRSTFYKHAFSVFLSYFFAIISLWPEK